MWIAAFALALAFAAVTAAPAQADSLSFTVPADAVVNREHRVELDLVSTHEGTYRTLVGRPAAAGPCAAVPADVPGVREPDRPHEGSPLGIGVTSGRGGLWQTVPVVGERRVCAWLHASRDQRSEVYAAAEAVYTVRQVRASVTLAAPSQGQTTPEGTRPQVEVRVEHEPFPELNGPTVELGGRLVPAERTCADGPRAQVDVLEPLATTRDGDRVLMPPYFVPHGDYRLCVELRDALGDNVIARDEAVYSTRLAPLVAKDAKPAVRSASRRRRILSCRQGRWIGRPAPTVTVAWLRNGRRIPGARSSRLRYARKHARSRFACRVEAVNPVTRRVFTTPVFVPAD